MTSAAALEAPAIRWDWSAAARGVLLALPAAAVAIDDVRSAALLAIGLVPPPASRCPPPGRTG